MRRSLALRRLALRRFTLAAAAGSTGRHPQLNRIRGANIDRTKIQVSNVLVPDQMGNQHKHYFILQVINFLTSKDVLQDRNLPNAGDAGIALLILILKNAAKHIHFAFTEANLVINFSLADHRLIDATDRNRIRLRRYVHRHFQSDVTVQVHSWLNVDVHTYVEILELRVHQRFDPPPTNAGLKCPRREGNAGADLEGRLLTVRRSNF